MKEIANDNFRWWNARKSAAASEESRGRPDLVELAMASNAHIAELQRQIVALNDARPSDVAERESHCLQMRAALAKVVEEGNRFDAIDIAMDEGTLIRFWNQIGIPARA